MGSRVLLCDNIGIVDNAVADYTPAEPRTMPRAQVMATLDCHALVA